MEHPLQIAFHGVDTSPAVETRIRDKVAKLERYFDRIIGCRVVVEHVHRSHSNLKTTDQPFHVSVVVEVPGEELVAKRDPKDRSLQKGHEDINVAIQDAFDTMERRLKDYVDRRWRDKRVRAS